MDKMSIEGLKKSFGDNKVLNDVSFSLSENEVSVLLGPNGAGKTTILNIILGLLKANQGVVFYETNELKIPYSTEYRKKFCYIPDEPILLDYLSGIENLKYNSHLYKVDLTRHSLELILDEFGILDAKDTLVKDYSRGMKQRLCLASMRLYNPEIIILDEPTIGLDIIAVRDLISMLKKFKSEGKSILISTHDINFSKQCADKVIVINKGVIVSVQTTVDIINQYDTIENAVITLLEAKNE